jgi:hypothetical protein
VRPSSSTPRRSSGPEGAAALTGALALAAAVLVVAAGPILTDDLWWHLALGEAYAEQGPWPDADPLLHTAHERAPIQHEWLFGVATHFVQRGFGFSGLRALHALSVLGILALAASLFRARAPLPAACLATASFVVLAWWRLIQLRPDLVSIAAVLALTRLLLEPEAGPGVRRIVASTAIFGIWANAHSLVSIGIALLLAALSGLALEVAARRRAGLDATIALGRARRLAIATGLGFAASLVNPRGLVQHLTFFASSMGTAIWRIEDEWQAFHPFAWRGVGAVSPLSLVVADGLIVGVAVAALLALRRRDGRTPDPLPLLLAAAGIAAFLVSVRFLWLGFLPLLFLLTAAGPGRLASRASGRIFAAASLALALAFPFATPWPSVARNLPSTPREFFGTPWVAYKYHVVGARFLAATGVEGRLFNKYLTGGFLGYWLAPRLRTFIDSRTEHYEREVFDDYANVSLRLGSGPGESMLDVLERRGVDLFFGSGVPQTGSREATLHTATHLAGAPGWLLVSRSVHHAIYLSRDARNAENLRRIADWYAAEGVPFDPERGLDVLSVLRERPDWAAAHELLPPDYAPLLDPYGIDDPDERYRALDRLAAIYGLLGAHSEQLALDRSARALRPGSKAPRRRLVYGLLRMGRSDEALAEVERLVALDPGDAGSAAAQAVAIHYARRRQGELGAPDPPPRLSSEAALDRFPFFEPGEQERFFADYHRTRSVRSDGPVLR